MMDLIAALAESAATDEFKHDVHAFARDERAPRIVIAEHAPWIKIARVLTQLMHAEPALPVDRVEIRGLAGCADFVGTATVEAGGETRTFSFVWDCHWRARQEDMVDYFGFPDQIRAAREFGWRCFSTWEQLPVTASSIVE